MSFYQKLKQRNVIKVAVAYGIAAWLLIQITATTFPVLNIPQWAVSLVTALILIGFPLALIFAWAFELTPDGIKLEEDMKGSGFASLLTGRNLDFIIIGLLIATVLYLLARQPESIIESESVSGPLDVTEQSASEQDGNGWENSIAVLPFVNMSSDPEQEYFSDGLSEELLNLLAKIPSLKVIGRTSSFAFKGKSEDLRAIGETLDVETLLEGSVRKSGNRVRITAQLIDTSDGSHIWSETYDRTMTDIFEVQDDVSAAIFEALQIHVGDAPIRGKLTENLEAYTLYLKAKAALNVSKLDNAEELLLQAIELDPNFAEAYDMLANTYWSLSGRYSMDETQKLVNEASARAIALKPGLVLSRTLHEASTFGPYIHLRTFEAYEKAAREQPDNTWVLESYVFLLAAYGYLEEARVTAERLVELDPLSPIARSQRVLTLYAVGHTDEAVAALEFTEQAERGLDWWEWPLDGINLREDQDGSFVRRFESWLQLNNHPDPGWFREIVNAASDPESGQAYMDSRIPQIAAAMAEQDTYDWQNALIGLYLYFGFLDRYFELTVAAGLGDSAWYIGGTHIWSGHIFRRLGFTAHPRYLEVADLHGIVHIWEKRGPPDFCEKLNEQWVCE